MKCWGLNRDAAGSGQLGNGKTVQQYETVEVIGLGSEVKSLVAGMVRSWAM